MFTGKSTTLTRLAKAFLEPLNATHRQYEALRAFFVDHGYETAKSRHIFRDFVNAAAHVYITVDGIDVHFQKRAHNPLLLAAGFEKTDGRVPWLGNKRLRLFFGK